MCAWKKSKYLGRKDASWLMVSRFVDVDTLVTIDISTQNQQAAGILSIEIGLERQPRI